MKTIFTQEIFTEQVCAVQMFLYAYIVLLASAFFLTALFFHLEMHWIPINNLS